MAYKRNIRPISVVGSAGFVPLSRGLVAVIDAEDVVLVCGRNWHAQVKPRQTYAASSPLVGERSMFMLHRVIAGAAEGRVVDHIDGDGLNNRKSNLRVCSHNDNMKNQVMHRINRIGLKGVWSEEGRFRAKIQRNGMAIHLGSFRTAEEAAAAYRGAEKALGRALDAA